MRWSRRLQSGAARVIPREANSCFAERCSGLRVKTPHVVLLAVQRKFELHRAPSPCPTVERCQVERLEDAHSPKLIDGTRVQQHSGDSCHGVRCVAVARHPAAIDATLKPQHGSSHQGEPCRPTRAACATR